MPIFGDFRAMPHQKSREIRKNVETLKAHILASFWKKIFELGSRWIRVLRQKLYPVQKISEIEETFVNNWVVR